MGTSTGGDEGLLAPMAPALPEGEELDQPDEEVAGDNGSGDSDGVVRVWLEDGRLTRVRVSPVWYRKLGRRTLEECFAEALALAALQIPVADVAGHRFVDPADFGPLPRFGPQAFAAFQTLFDDVEKRWDEALERRENAAARPRPATVGTYKGVTVHLDEAGWPNRVGFDKAWLEGAQAGAICTHVMRAAELAHERHVPVDGDDSELDELQSEHEHLAGALKAMLNPK